MFSQKFILNDFGWFGLALGAVALVFQSDGNGRDAAWGTGYPWVEMLFPLGPLPVGGPFFAKLGRHTSRNHLRFTGTLVLR